MATIETRAGKTKTTYRVRWIEGGRRGGAREFEPFDNLAVAEHFQRDVDFHGQCWPPNYIPRVGYVTPAQFAALSRAAALDAQTAGASTARPLLEFATDYVNHLTGIQAKTRADYHRLIANYFAVYPALAGADIADRDTFTERDVGAWVNWLEAGVRDPDNEQAWLRTPKSPKTIANAHGLLYSIAASATRGEKPLRTVNPCADTRLPSLDDATAEEMVFLTPAEFAILLAAAKPKHRPELIAFAGTGLRFSELAAQQAVDYAPGETRVQRAWQSIEGGRRLKEPKSKAGRRRVTLDPFVDDVFAAASAGKASGAFLFTAEQGGTWWHSHFFTLAWQPAVYRAVRCEAHRAADREVGMKLDGQMVKLTRIRDLRQYWLRPCGCEGTLGKVPRIHDLRHTHVAWQIAGNVPLSAIARRVGHDSVLTTDKTYGHLLPELDERQANAVAAAWAAAGLVSVSLAA
jgi:integrase